MTRIVAGTHRGRRIAAPPGQDTRPTSDRVREALFSLLESRVGVSGCRFADLYAGSGAVGLEAASRGAVEVLFVESDARAARIVRENTAALGFTGICRLVSARVSAVLAQPPVAAFDIVFADPPYDVADAEIARMLSALAEFAWLADDALVVVERSTRSPEPVWPTTFTPAGGRRYGETTLWLASSVVASPRVHHEQEGVQ